MDTSNILKVLIISFVLGCAALMSSCTKQEKTAAGALIGAGTGIAIGAATGGTGGAVAGGIIGGVGGGLIGNSMRDDRDYRD
jgi:osmotically inducible lipoprotein OsmB